MNMHHPNLQHLYLPQPIHTSGPGLLVFNTNKCPQSEDSCPQTQTPTLLKQRSSVLLNENKEVLYSLDWAVLASTGLVKTPRPMSDLAAKENT